jgi:hypothetical protein
MAARRSDDEYSSDSDERFGDLGEYGITSGEFPAVAADDRRFWEEQRRRAADEQHWRVLAQLRRERIDRLEKLYAQRVISGPATTLLQDEFAEGYLPDVYIDGTGDWYMVWSDRLTRRFSLGEWERYTQDHLPIDDPERVTQRLPALPQELPAIPVGLARPWHPALDSRLARVTPHLRVTPPVHPAQPTRKERGR